MRIHREEVKLMQIRVYFVRHAEPDFSIKDDLTRPLTDKGMADSKKVTSILADKEISMIYSSPYKRAVDTIKDFSESRGIEIIIKDNLRERRVGDWVEDFRAYSEKQWSDFEYKLPGGECLKEVKERNINALLEILAGNSGRNIAIATHGTALSTIINHYNSEFGHGEFWSIADKMPYILCFTFNDMELESVEELAI